MNGPFKTVYVGIQIDNCSSDIFEIIGVFDDVDVANAALVENQRFYMSEWEPEEISKACLQVGIRGDMAITELTDDQVKLIWKECTDVKFALEASTYYAGIK